jgi:rhomboid protease GluP
MDLPYEWLMRVDKIKDSLRGLFGSKEPPRPKMCPACGTLVGTTATRCHECGTSLNFSLSAAGRGVSGFFGGETPVTSVLLIVNILMFVVSIASSIQSGEGLSLTGGVSSEVLFRLGAQFEPVITEGHQWFRLLTACFLHLSIIHIGFNMWVLWDVGRVIERVYGSARYLFLYTLTGITGNIVSVVWDHHSARPALSAGASGALMGLIGLMIAITTRRSGAAIKAERTRLIWWVVIIFAMGAYPGVHVNNSAHFGGLASGFLLGRLFADREPTAGSEMKRAYALGWLAALIIIVSFVLMLLHVRDGGA